MSDKPKNATPIVDITQLRHPMFYKVLEELRRPDLNEKERWKLLKTINRKTVNMLGARVV